MLCFSTTLVVAATCLLVSAGDPETTVTTCEGDNLHRLSCETGVINVQAAMYGRADNVTCSEGKSPQEISNTDCSLMHCVDALKLLCNGRKLCEISLDIFRLQLNPCKETFKYLQTKYTCIAAIHLLTCEESLAHLQCNEGQVISVFAADFGRHNQITCSYKRPASQIQNTDCYRQRSHVFDSCNGKNSCIVKASSSVFGDPCEGTYKYLEVAYFCEDPVTNLN